MMPHPATKVLSREATLRRFTRPRNRTLVFTNGCFDVLHRGHVELLAGAAALGDDLLVAVNTDASVRRLKGPERPVVGEEDRALVVAALGCVEAVTLFEEDTPADLIAALLPDVLVKGGDYEPHQVVGREAVENAGGRVIILPLVAGRSTTTLLERIMRL